MSGFIDSVRRASNFIANSRAAVDTDGDMTVTTGVLANSIDSLQTILNVSATISPADLPAYLDAIKNLSKGCLDDRKFLLEKLVTIMSKMPSDSGPGKTMSDFFISTLYKDLEHPSANFLSTVHDQLNYSTLPPKRNYAYRTENGENYSPSFPTLGMAGAPYARSVPSNNLCPPSSLPDPGLVFDLLLKRDESTFKPHPGGLSAMFFGVANLVIHSIFDTNRQDWTINDASSYVDLDILYGNSVSKMKRPVSTIRKFDGTGKIWEDCFADSRLLFMPPQTAAVLVLLSRNHNYICEKMLAINERGTFSSPPPSDDDKKKKQDDEIFERARLVNCGAFAKIILHDYVGGILGLTRDGSAWRLNLPEVMRDPDHEFAPTGQGSQISLEFNQLYRWHASTSAPDAKWIDGVFQRLFQGKPYNQVTVDDFTSAAGASMRPPADIRQWTFGGLTRGPDGRFKDSELANIIMNATEAPAHAFGARSTPDPFRIVEIMTIMQSRTWGACSLNEFRRFFGLKPYANFKEWNPDPKVYDAAQALYRDIENLELHVGMQAEDTKPSMPGAGLCPSYTMSRAILADAVVLVRSDPFLTTQYTPYNLTAWGYQDTIMDPNDGSYGGMLSKLLYRALPGQFPVGSAYGHFPLLVPNEMKGFMEARGDPSVSNYNWARPVPGATPIAVSAQGMGQILRSPAVFGDGYDDRASRLVAGAKLDRALVKQVLADGALEHAWDRDLEAVALALMRQKAIGRPGFGSMQLDLAKEVLNMLPIYFLSEEVFGLPLKTELNPGGVYRPEDLYVSFADVGNYVLLNLESEHDWPLRQRATACASTVISEIHANLDRLSYGIFSITGLVDTIADYFSAKTDRSAPFLTALIGAGKGAGISLHDLAASLFAEVVPSAPLYSAALANVVGYYLAESMAAQRAELARAAALTGPAADAQLLAYAREALRAISPISATYRTAKTSSAVDGVPVTAGQRVMASMAGDASSFGPGGGQDAYDVGTSGLMMTKLFEKSAPLVLRAVFSLKNVRTGGKNGGQFPRFTQELFGVQQTSFLNDKSAVSPWPTGLLIQWDL